MMDVRRFCLSRGNEAARLQRAASESIHNEPASGLPNRVHVAGANHLGGARHPEDSYAAV
jgi:hypothetical protein